MKLEVQSTANFMDICYDLQIVISKKAHFKNFMITLSRIYIVYADDIGFLKILLNVQIIEL